MKSLWLIVRSFGFASEGLTWALQTQRNMRIHFAIAFAAMVLCILLDLSKVEIILVFFAIAGVITCELFNTAIEAVVDLVTSEYRLYAKIAKDVAAAAVLLTALHALIVGYMVFSDKVFPLRLRHLQGIAANPVIVIFVGLGIILLVYFSLRAMLVKK